MPLLANIEEVSRREDDEDDEDVDDDDDEGMALSLPLGEAMGIMSASVVESVASAASTSDCFRGTGITFCILLFAGKRATSADAHKRERTAPA